MPVFESEDHYTEAIFNRLVNVTIKIFTLLRSAANIFLVETRGEFHKAKSNMLEKEESIIGGIWLDTYGIVLFSKTRGNPNTYVMV